MEEAEREISFVPLCSKRPTLKMKRSNDSVMESDRKPLLLSFFCCLSLSLNYSNKKPVGRHFVRFFSGGKSLATEEVSDVASRSIGAIYKIGKKKRTAQRLDRAKKKKRFPFGRSMSARNTKKTFSSLRRSLTNK